MINHHNTSVELYNTHVVKTTLRAYTHAETARLGDELLHYTELFSDEPLEVPEVQDIRRIPVDNQRSKLRIVSARNHDPNLQSLPPFDRYDALALTLSTIAQMRTMRHTTLLRTPIDAIGPNLHVASLAGRVTLVDTFPPLPRDEQGVIPLQNVRFGQLPFRRSHVNFFRGTRSGAILRAMMSVTLGTRPSQRITSALSGNHEWCHDIVPDSLTGDEKDMLHREISRRFIGQVMLGGTAGALHYATFKTTDEHE